MSSSGEGMSKGSVSSWCSYRKITGTITDKTTKKEKIKKQNKQTIFAKIFHAKFILSSWFFSSSWACSVSLC